MPIFWDKNYQQLNDRIRSFTVLSWYCKHFIDDAHVLLRDSDYSRVVYIVCNLHVPGKVKSSR
jgi:hypothetical protein